ncbi:MAG TPA: UTP--glucose-1-phosphate uridylyltransferase [Bryobacteraceae bacterium]|nr:UTP--glucose-1-phosphate uridylyltransferase [Bryobacteraceae bacterium]
MSILVRIILAQDPEMRNRPLDAFCRSADAATLLRECAALEEFRQTRDNLYERVRAQFFLYAIHRFHLPYKPEVNRGGLVPFGAAAGILKRRFEEAIEILLRSQAAEGPSAAVCSGLAAAYRGLGFKTLADQVRHSVRSVRGNQWMSRIGHPADYPLSVRPELLQTSARGLYPILRETTPVRMDLSHSAWSDIFFLGMDFPEGARVLNVSIDLAVRGGVGDPQPPVEAYFRVIDEPVLRLTSVDLETTADVTSFAELTDFARDYLGLLKAAVIASGIVPQAMEVCDAPLADLTARLAGAGRGVELVSFVRDIPKGSRLAVSTNLLACLISACMRATNQIHALTGTLEESARRLVAARAILGEWLGGSGGGWQDSGGVWPGMKLIQGVEASSGDPEFEISRGCLLPQHHVFSENEVSRETRQKLQDSLVLVHGGMAQDVGPVLEMVTDKYLLRSEPEWKARQEAIAILDTIVKDLGRGNVKALGAATERNFFGPIQTIIPWASNLYTETLIERVRGEMASDFWGFWMLGGMSGGGMGFIFSPQTKMHAQERLQCIMSGIKRRLERAVPFAMEPVVYDFAINERGASAELLVDDRALLPAGYYNLIVPRLLRMDPRLLRASRRAELDSFAAACRTLPEQAGMMHSLFDRLLPQASPGESRNKQTLKELLEEHGFDRVQHDQIQADLRSGRIGLAQNRVPASITVEDVRTSDVVDASGTLDERFGKLGREVLRTGAVAVVSLAGGAGSRWTRGAGVVKALNPFCKFAGRYRNFIDVHLAKSTRASQQVGVTIPHVITTSFLTHAPIQEYLTPEKGTRYAGPLLLSPGKSIGLKLVPMVRDLRFAWQETTQQVLDEQKQKVRESLYAALISWAQHAGEGSDYTDNLPLQCLNPTGHWYEVPNMLRNGTLLALFEERPQLRYLMVHNVDTLGANLDPALLGIHIESGVAMTTEVISRYIEDRGGGLARVDGRVRLIEGLALPSEEFESSLSFYNTSTTWIDIEQLLKAFSLTRADLADAEKVAKAIRAVAAHMPTYVTIKDVKKRWGKGQEDVFPVTQYEKLWGDMTALPALKCGFIAVPRVRGQQLKEPAQLDGWFRDGSARYIDSICAWGASGPANRSM